MDGDMLPDDGPDPPPPSFALGGEMGALVRGKDWAATAVGPMAGWPQSLRTALSILLTSRYQMWMGWGPELTFFYNDAYRPTLGVKHPRALGASAREVWQEIWTDIGPRIAHVLSTGEATWDEALLLFLERSGYAEETYHTFSYSPLADDAGAVVGMLCVVMEETERIIGGRRLAILRRLASDLAGKTVQAEVLDAVGRQLGAGARDLPFALVYLFDPDGTARLARAIGVAAGHPLAPEAIDPAAIDAAWPAGRILAGAATMTQEDLARHGASIPAGAWDKPPHQAVVSPIARQGQTAPGGFLVAAVNPYRQLDPAYLGFIGLVAGQIAAGLANAHAYEAERRRAEALAELDRAKTTFFSNVSHEFRTPLTLMLGPLEDLLARPAEDPLAAHRALVQVAHRSGVRLLKLVNTLLDFARLEAGRVQAQFEPVDLATFTAELASSFETTAAIAGLRLHVACLPLPQPVHVDRDLWEKVILNLVSNAFKFTFAGTIEVETKLSADGTQAELVVGDTGTGIPDAELPYLFERFRRVEGARGRSIEGSGIGLALVQELVRLHGGTIRVESRVGEGSVFTVSLPFGTAHLPAGRIGPARAPATSVRAQAYIDEALGWMSDDPAVAEDVVRAAGADDPGTVPAAVDATRRFVLLADDNADMRAYVRRLLAERYVVEAVADGQAALDAARRRRPDLVLSDVMMPRLDGFGLLRALRADPELREVPVILLSARAGEEASVEGLEAGADDYLTKPFNARELLARVHANLEMTALRREAVRVEHELRRQAQLAQERAEGILASINDGFFTLDAAWLFTYINAAAERMMGETRELLLGRDHWDHYSRYLGTPLETHYRRAMTERTSVAFEMHFPPRDRWMEVRAYPARDGGLSVYFQDITERKQAEAALRDLNETLEQQVRSRTAEVQAKEARLRAVFEASFTYQGLIALDGTLLDANATSLAGIGAPLAAVVGRPFWDTPWFTATPGMPAMVREAIAVAAGGDVVRQEIRVNLPVGGWRWFEFQLRPVRDARGAVVSIVPEAVDVTGRRHAEEALRQAQKMESIGQLTGGVAHDFNNLLTIIVGNLETVQRQLRTPRANVAALEQPVDSAMRGAQRAVSLTQRLLAFSRQQPLDPKPVDISRLVTGMSDLLHRSIGEQIAVETILAGGLARANVDAHQLEIAVINLAVNARDAMPGGGRLTITTANVRLDAAALAETAEAVAGDYIMLAVADTGTGMTPEALARAFEPFFTTKDIGHGTGLGLSQVYGFIRQSGGHVTITSAVGQGTTVRLYLPRIDPDEATTVAEPVASAERRASGETVLIVEDDPDVRAFTHEVLSELGYAVVDAPNGSAALEVLATDRAIDLLFTDVGLPGGMNGRQLAEAARRLRPGLKVLFTTGYARDAIVHEGLLDPGVHLITKPFTYAGLAGKVRDLLDASPGPA
jgi:PAS domain S-box-containing protein